MKKKKHHYYQFGYKRLRQEITEVDPMFNGIDNDLIKEEIKSPYRKQFIQPSDNSYHDYYFKYMEEANRPTLHESYEFEARRGTSRKEQRERYGDLYRQELASRNFREGIEPNKQPTINRKFLNKLARQGKVIIYSDKEK